MYPCSPSSQTCHGTSLHWLPQLQELPLTTTLIQQPLAIVGKHSFKE
ncbi:hypothetical protein MC7420_2344 [Coleofasciculus chthonoplastes PCC 7420]|uniref:Uncharacterized protein n=1 Tax=Coleofasciculus chthonoplastes PCC 7420 TaxID=118168 RepID=B4W235_9CYAN|nr:hypothetical protein MC7420_2344 [Coleofasciculus chthonoplastes PCC 7420]